MDGRTLLKQYDHFKEQAQFYRDRCYQLEGELRVVNPALYRAQQQINHLERQAAQLQKQNQTLRRQLADLKGQLDLKPKPVPAFVKANVPARRGRGPGRPAGHPPARRQRPRLSARTYEFRGRRLERRLKELARTSWQEADADRIAARLRKHEKELTLFLWDPAVDPDNNAAERALRPAVVLRKITGGSRSQRGARATAVLMSVVRTALQQDRPLLETIRTLIQNAWAGINPGLLTDVLANTS